jgi:hypothetical protein
VLQKNVVRRSLILLLENKTGRSGGDSFFLLFQGHLHPVGSVSYVFL